MFTCTENSCKNDEECKVSPVTRKLQCYAAKGEKVGIYQYIDKNNIFKFHLTLHKHLNDEWFT